MSSQTATKSVSPPQQQHPSQRKAVASTSSAASSGVVNAPSLDLYTPVGMQKFTNQFKDTVLLERTNEKQPASLSDHHRHVGGGGVVVAGHSQSDTKGKVPNEMQQIIESAIE